MMLTPAVSLSMHQAIPDITDTIEAAGSIYASLFTATIFHLTLIHIFGRKNPHIMFK